MTAMAGEISRIADATIAVFFEAPVTGGGRVANTTTLLGRSTDARGVTYYGPPTATQLV